MPKLKTISNLIAIVLVVSGILWGALSVHADGYDKAGKFGLEDIAGPNGADLKGAGADIPTILGGIVGTALSLITVVFFILVVYAGIVWMTARGDESKGQKARSIIFAAIFGMIMVLSAYIITNFIFNAVGKNAGGGSPASQTGATASSTNPGPEKTDENCKLAGGTCEEGATGDGQACTTNGKAGKSKAGLCLTKKSATYLCCIPNP